jgi:Family of unknown function (DUF5906)/Primase C terminal 2 (PriCT-2)/RepB DNA-primase from phage plasmid
MVYGETPSGSQPAAEDFSRGPSTDEAKLEPDRSEAESFLAALDPNATSFTFQTFDDDIDRKSKSAVKVPIGSLSGCWNKLVRYNNLEGAGIFVTVNETRGEGRAAADVVRVRAVFVDLDGAPLPDAFHASPHIIVESSRGKWHVYWLVRDFPLTGIDGVPSMITQETKQKLRARGVTDDEIHRMPPRRALELLVGPDKDKFRSTQQRLAAHYGGDPKVIDLPRVMRLPGFVHQKVKDGIRSEPFRTRLVEAHDFEPYTIEQVTTGLPPVEEKAKASASGNCHDAPWSQAEEAKLREALGYIPTDEDILKEKLGDSHDAFVRIGRAIERLGWGDHGFAIWRDWCAQNADKLNEQGLQTQWRSFQRTRDNAQKPVTIATVYWYAKQFGWKPSTSVTIDDFRAYMPAHAYLYLPTRELWPAGSVNARIPPVVMRDARGESVLDDDGEPEIMKASLWLDRNRPVEQMTWAPGLPMLIADRVVDQGGWVDKPGVTIFNLYRPPTIPHGDPTKAGPWVDHVHTVYPDDADHMIKWFAHRAQRPQEKVNHGLVLGGPPGTGKDTLLEPVKRAVGPWNVAEVSPQQMLGRFNGFVRSVILRVSEARDLGEMNRFALYEHMKAYLAAPPDVIRCDEKNLREHSVFNVMGVVITSNRKDSFFLPADDRRHYVAWTDITREDFADGYWRTIWGWYDAGGDRHVAAYLAALDISDFDSKAPPPKTTAFWEIIEANRSPENSDLADALDALGRPSAVTLSMLRKDATGDFLEWISDRKNSRTVPHRMGDCGYVPVRNDTAKDGAWKIDGKRQVVYAKRELSVHDRHAAAAALVKGPPKQEKMQL